MALTDLTGTTWKFNDTLDFTGITLETEFTVDFKISGAFQIETYNGFWYHSGGGDNYLVYSVNEGNPSFVYNETTGQWSGSKIIKIFGGTDATNSTFITWLQNNAEQLEFVTDLTNTEWIINSTVSGTVVDSTTYQGSFNINFTSNSNLFTELDHTWNTSTFQFSISYKNSSATTTVYSSTNSGWTAEAYQTIRIFDGEDVTNSNLILWLQSQGTQAKYWKFKNTGISITDNTYYYVNFTLATGGYYGDSYPMPGFYQGSYSGGMLGYLFYDNSTLTVQSVYYTTNGWVYQTSRTVKILDGKDAISTDFLTWLNDNAIEIIPVLLKRKSWVFNNEDLVPIYGSNKEFNINFTSNNTSFKKITFSSNGNIVYQTTNSSDITVYNGSWSDDSYRTVEFTGGNDILNSQLQLLMAANATWTELQGVFISYSGSEIATMEESGTKTLLTSGKYCESDIIVDYTKPTPKLQEKTVNPTTSQQIVTPDEITYAFNIPTGTQNTDTIGVTLRWQNVIQSLQVSANYDWDGEITASDGTVITISGTYVYNQPTMITNFTVTGPSTVNEIFVVGGTFYVEFVNSAPANGTVTKSVLAYQSGQEEYDGLSKVIVNAMSSGSATTPATTITANPSISISSSGLITATTSKTQSVTPTVSAGYVSSGTAGTITISGSNTQQMTVQAAQTITPTTTAQTIASGKYLTGTQTIAGDANLVAGNIKKDVTIFGVTGTHEGGVSYPAANGESF